MKHIYVRLLLLTFGITLLTSCEHHENDLRLLAAERLMDSNPDSAYIILKKMNGSVLSWSESSRMKYYLLFSEAQNKMSIKFTSASTMKQVVKYYDVHGDDTQQTKSYYLLGSVYRDLGDAPESMSCFNHCVSLCDTTKSACNYFLLCRVYAQMGGLYHQQQMPQNSLVEFNKACKYTLLAKDTLAYINYYEQKIYFYNEMGYKDSAAFVSENSYRLYNQYGYKEYARMSLAYAIYKYTTDGNLVKAKKYLDIYLNNPNLYDKRGKVLKDKTFLYYYRGMYNLYSHQLDSAKTFFTQLLQSSSMLKNRQGAYEGLYLTYKKLGNTDSALKYHEKYVAVSDTIQHQLKIEKLQQIQSMYDYQHNQAEIIVQNGKLAKSRLIIVTLISLFIICAMFVFKMISQQKQKVKSKIDSINYEYSLSLAKLDKAKSDLLLMEKNTAENSEIIHSKEIEVEHLKRIIDDLRVGKKKMGQWNEKDVLAEPVVTGFHDDALHLRTPSEENWHILMSFAKCEFPQLFEKFTDADILKDTDKRICILAKLRFSPSEMSILLDKKAQAISNRRVRLLQKMFNILGKSSLFDEKIREIW